MKTLDNLLPQILPSIKRYSSDPSVKSAKKITEALWAWGDQTHEKMILDLNEHGYAKGCEKTCSYCCYQNVNINVFEAIVITDWIRDNLNENILSKIYENTKSIYNNSIEDTFDSERWRRREPCSCLDHENKTCIIYPVRPLECRLAISHDINSCQGNFYNKATTSITIFPPSEIEINLPEETEFKHLINDISDYVHISMVGAISTYLMDKILSKRELTGKFVYPKTQNLQSSINNMELNKMLNYTLNGDVSIKIKSLVRLKPDGVFECAKTTDSMM